MDEMKALDEAATRYRQTEAAHSDAREQAIAAALIALRAGHRPTDVANRSPFSAAYVRRLAREAGIESPRATPPATRED